MTLEEIKDKLGVDLTEKNRKAHIVYLRGHYIDAEYAKGRPYLKICKELKHNHATAFHYLQRKKYYKHIEEYNEMKIVFETGNVELFKEVEHRLQNKTYIHYDNFEKKNKKVNEIKINKLKVDYTPVKKWHYLKIIHTLRKDNKHDLWNKPMIDFTIKDYQELEKLYING